MRQFDIEVVQWIGEGTSSSAVETTHASLIIKAGPTRTPITQAEDLIALIIRPHINVPAFALARWLLANWWRLRWEPSPRRRDLVWFQAHSLAAIGDGWAWPAIEFSSDGDFVQVQHSAEEQPDVAGVRYLRETNLEVPAHDFETAIDCFIDQVSGRLAVCVPDDRTIAELATELAEERSDPDVSRTCKRQAMAGINPGEASEAWFDDSNALYAQAGSQAGDELMAVLPNLEDGLAGAQGALDAMQRSPTSVDLSFAIRSAVSSPEPELPWRRGERLANELRRQLKLPDGPISAAALGKLLGVELPLPVSSSSSVRTLAGGVRARGNSQRTTILVPSHRCDSQRFYLARLIGCAAISPEAEPVVPVTVTYTALQKFERAFAQELLCPWVDLEAFLEDEGMAGDDDVDEEAIARAADHFEVSQLLIRSTLVNKGKLARGRIPPA